MLPERSVRMTCWMQCLEQYYQCNYKAEMSAETTLFTITKHRSDSVEQTYTNLDLENDGVTQQSS